MSEAHPAKLALPASPPAPIALPATSGGRPRRPATTGPSTAIPVDALNAETSPEALGAVVTPVRGFFVRSHFAVPSLRASTWILTLGGAVAHPRTWSLEELRALPRSRVVATLECAGNSRRRLPEVAPGELPWGDHAVGNAVWEGVSLSHLLREATPLPGANEVVFTGADQGPASRAVRRFARSLTGELAGREDVLVATEMNGAPLSADHGWPARLIVPGWYGMAWVKWLSSIHVRRARFKGYYQASRYVYRYRRDGQTVTEPVRRLRVKSLILSPSPGERLARSKSYVVTGKAWAGFGPVSRVEVDVGTGWRPAQLTPGDGSYAWTVWEYAWSPERRGPVLLRARATDAQGDTQPESPFVNDFQYGVNSVHSVPVVVS